MRIVLNLYITMLGIAIQYYDICSIIELEYMYEITDPLSIGLRVIFMCEFIIQMKL